MASPSPKQLFSGNLKQLRDLHRMSQEDLAKKSGVSRSIIATAETGRSMPSEDAIQALATALKVTVAYLFATADEQTLLEGAVVLRDASKLETVEQLKIAIEKDKHIAALVEKTKILEADLIQTQKEMNRVFSAVLPDVLEALRRLGELEKKVAARGPSGVESA